MQASPRLIPPAPAWMFLKSSHCRTSIATRLENVVATPHSGGITPESLGAGLQLCIQSVWNFLNGHPTNVVVSGDGCR
jgi:phosphoglycerate dehydrogenase-like enzyme